MRSMQNVLGYVIISKKRLILIFCVKAFPPGKFNKIPFRPNVSSVNDLGDFAIKADRLAIIDGEGKRHVSRR